MAGRGCTLSCAGSFAYALCSGCGPLACFGCDGGVTRPFLLHAGAPNGIQCGSRMEISSGQLCWEPCTLRCRLAVSTVRPAKGNLFTLPRTGTPRFPPEDQNPRCDSRKYSDPASIEAVTLSAAGMFLLLPQNVSARLGERQDFILKLQNDDLTVSGEIMRRDADGIGVAFRSTRKQRATIKDFLSRHYPSRIPSSLDVLLRWKGTAQRAQLWNLSTEGAYVVTPDGSSLPDVLDMELTKPLGTRARARVRWFNPHGEFGKPPGLGVEFTSVQSRWRLFKYLWTQKRKEGVSR
jgi:hypothetical protein